MEIGILCPLATFELHGVTDEIQAVAVMIKVRLHMFGKAGLRTAQRLVHHQEGLVRSPVFFIQGTVFSLNLAPFIYKTLLFDL